ncbi:MAG: hypothetical protein VB092_07575 [Oscillospiraceae bacterium]|nr:hypothetical protein [Oscillospiraceae bacterium]
MSDVRIPIVVGVTGHRALRPQDRQILFALVTQQLVSIRERCPHSPVVMLNSVAAGADLLCAQAALELGIPLLCALPFPLESYRADFDAESARQLDGVLARAAEVFCACADVPVGARERDGAYRKAGAYVADRCQLLLALWDGGDARAEGCGTAETVAALLGNAPDSPTFPVRGAAVIHIDAPRQGDTRAARETPCTLEACAGSAARTLEQIDAINAELAPQAEAPQTDTRDTLFERLRAVYEAADRRALALQKRYHRALLTLAALCSALVTMFLLYDELESNLFLPVYALLLFGAFFVLRAEERRAYHARYMRFRILAETLRTQGYLARAGLDGNVCDSFTWTQRSELVWVREAAAALLAGAAPAPESAAAAREWMDEQYAYHTRAAGKTGTALRARERFCFALSALSVLLFAAVFALEFTAGGFFATDITSDVLRGALRMHAGQSVTVRGVFKILLGTVSAASLFFSSYFGKLSLERQTEDHEKMAALYALARQRSAGGAEDCAALAREEIVEVGNWYSYCKENRPGIDL